MDTDLAIFLTADMLWTAALIAGPILGVALLVGLLISVLQVVTQIQEMTLTFVPKIVAIVVVILVLGGWMLGTLVEFASNLYRSIPQLI